MFVIIARAASADRVPALLAAWGALPLPRAAERTAGPEAMALAERAEDALDLVRIALEQDCPALGLGIGALRRPLPAGVREAQGEAIDAARGALELAAAPSRAPLAVRAADARQEGTAEDAEAVLRLVAWMIRTRSAGQWRTVRALRDRPGISQRDLAQHLGITQQSVSRALRTSGWREESAARPLLARLLAMIDLTSTGPAAGPPASPRTVS